VRPRLALACLVLSTVGLALAPPRRTLGGIDVALVGDLMLGRDVALAHADGDWRGTLEAVEPLLAGADLAFGNLESPLTAAPLLRPAVDLRGPPASAGVLARLGIDLLSLANNHSWDAGDAGLRETMEALRSVGLAAVGPSAVPWRGVLNGSRLVFLAFDDTQADLDLREAAIAVASERGRADLVLVSLHWGVELEPAPNERERHIALALAEAGADLIVGHGPHVLQEIEWVWGAGRGRPTLVAYSLGNALFDSPAPPAARRSAVLIVHLDRLGVRSGCIVPIEIRPPEWDIRLAAPEAASWIVETLGAAPRPGEATLPVCAPMSS
jgi:poly-gamma-glutamate synthesis protein (capsule biosynthesis protein)